MIKQRRSPPGLALQARANASWRLRFRQRRSPRNGIKSSWNMRRGPGWTGFGGGRHPGYGQASFLSRYQGRGHREPGAAGAPGEPPGGKHQPRRDPVIREVVFLEGQPFRFKAGVEVLPGFELPPYTKIRVPKKEVKVEEEEVARSLEELRQKSAEYVPVEGRGVVDGDYVVVEWKGRDLKTKRFLPTEKNPGSGRTRRQRKGSQRQPAGDQTGGTRKFVSPIPGTTPRRGWPAGRLNTTSRYPRSRKAGPRAERRMGEGLGRI